MCLVISEEPGDVRRTVKNSLANGGENGCSDLHRNKIYRSRRFPFSLEVPSLGGNESNVFDSVNERSSSIFRRAKFPPIDRFTPLLYFLSKEDFIFHPLSLLFAFRFIYSATRRRQKQLLPTPFHHDTVQEGLAFFPKIPTAFIVFIAKQGFPWFSSRRD